MTSLDLNQTTTTTDRLVILFWTGMHDLKQKETEEHGKFVRKGRYFDCLLDILFQPLRVEMQEKLILFYAVIRDATFQEIS